MSSYDVNHDLEVLLGHIERLGSPNADSGLVEVKFKTLFDDDLVSNSLESLAGTLKAAKKKARKDMYLREMGCIKLSFRWT